MATLDYRTPGREMTVGSVLSRGFGAIAAAPLLFLGISFALAAVPSVAVRLAMTTIALAPPTSDASAVNRAVATFFGSTVVWFVFYLSAQGLLFRVTVAQLDARPEPFGAHAGAAARALPRLFGLAVLMTLAVLLGWVLLFVPGMMLAVMWSVAPPALVAERCGVFAAFGRSRDLTRGARWRIFGLVVLVYAIYLVASTVGGIGLGIATGSTSAFGVVPTVIVSSIASVLLQTAFTAVWSATQSVLYVELRDWKEGPPDNRLSEIFA